MALLWGLCFATKRNPRLAASQGSPTEPLFYAVQAVWVLGFAFATWARVGVLAYWAALLAGALPAMAWLARSQRLSNIIGALRCR